MIRGEDSADQIGAHIGVLGRNRGAFLGPRLNAGDAQFVHNTADQPQGRALTGIIELSLKSAGTRSAVRGIEELLNLGGQALAPASAWTWGIAAFAPRVVAGPSDAQHAGHEHDREVGLLLLDELIHLDQACVFAKKAAAFFKNSFSSFSCRFDSSSSSIRARSFGESAVSGSGFWARYFVTQLPSVPSLISNSRATSAIARSDSITSCTASALNCLLNLRRLVDTITSFRLNVVYQNHDTPWASGGTARLVSERRRQARRSRTNTEN